MPNSALLQLAPDLAKDVLGSLDFLVDVDIRRIQQDGTFADAETVQASVEAFNQQFIGRNTLSTTLATR